MKNEKKEALKYLFENGRFTLKVEFARQLCADIGVEFNEKWIRTTNGYREQGIKGQERVSVTDIAEGVAKQLGVEPDEKLLERANWMNGEGSHRDLYAQAYIKPLM